MNTPKRMTSLAHWYKAARETLPKIPDVTSSYSGWQISHVYADVDVIIFVLHSNIGGKTGVAHVTIDRRSTAIGI